MNTQEKLPQHIQQKLNACAGDRSGKYETALEIRDTPTRIAFIQLCCGNSGYTLDREYLDLTYRIDYKTADAKERFALCKQAIVILEKSFKAHCAKYRMTLPENVNYRVLHFALQSCM